ncbi:hypothetical protein [Mesorhizobium sp. M8A.F.Ca.ET.021.01.1.1]|uniref:hypothetical protein n=1 Tax=Mesorhizobium sp. M8A.F.Ca.ET.021.01.1.1 TaxID=2496757 RepID=UPI000FCA07B8|nr:hypothetical protein [Mesorhizobium sp. M8A.F.Ca.ET.021.01.1.1]RUW57152.1 hypothetical protein EOA36_00785 [Mesorhizobium sp. M8A.F.Ca.ET.021.01.1.1]
MTWIMTATGRRVDFLRPDVNEITLSDIGISLSRVARFGGHSPLKIGQHVCEVATLMMMRATEQGMSEKEIAEAGIVGLVHDFPEAYCCDVMTPLKRLLGTAYSDIEARLHDVIVKRFELEGLFEKYHDLLKWADFQAVTEEARRYSLDGKYVSEITGELEDRPHQWTDPNAEAFLSDTIWEDEEDRQYAVIMTFMRLMLATGRGYVLTPKTTGIPGTSVDMVRETTEDLMPMPPILLSGDVYF